ncbi:MAG: rod shape-determining protein MreD [Myxococcota bacterium]
MKRLVILFVAGFIAVLLQVTLLAHLPFGSLKPELVLIVVLYVGVFLPATEGGVLSFALGYLSDLFTGHLMGLFTFTRVTAWLVARLASRMLNLKSVPAQTIFVALYTIIDYFVMVAALRFFGGGDYPVPEAGSAVWKAAILNAVAAPFVIMVLLWLERRLSTDEEPRSFQHLR